MRLRKSQSRLLTTMQMMNRNLSLSGKKMMVSPRLEDVDVAAEVDSEVASVVITVEDIEVTMVASVEDSEEAPMVIVEDSGEASAVATEAEVANEESVV